MTSLNNGKLTSGRGNGLLRPVAENFDGPRVVRKTYKNIDPRKNYGPMDLLRMQSARQGRKCSVFMDHENLSIYAQERGFNIDYYDLKYYLADESEGRQPQEFFCYVAIDPRKEHAKDSVVRRLEDDGWLVKRKRGVPVPDGGYKCGMSVDMAVDIISFSIEARPDIVVIATGNQDFVAVARKLRERGIRCEVAAFPENVSQALINSASSFINLEKYFEALRENGGRCGKEYRESMTEPDYPDYYANYCREMDESGDYTPDMKYNGIDSETPDRERSSGRDERQDCPSYDEYDI
jgi:uncharacterized LabA/DUF88 family protein